MTPYVGSRVEYADYLRSQSSFVDTRAYEPFPPVGSCYAGGCDHMTVIDALVAQQRSL